MGDMAEYYLEQEQDELHSRTVEIELPKPLPPVVFDTEVYKDYFLIAFRNVDTGSTAEFEMYPGHPLDITKVAKIMRTRKVISFNGNNYDLLMVTLALNGFDNLTIKRASDAIIQSNMKPWIVAKQIGVQIIQPDHIDLIEVAPGMASLKIYGGRLHADRLQDLPVDPSDSITPELRPLMRAYCGNDLDTTIGLYKKLLPQIRLREQMTEQYGIDLRSKSDAQIAEAVIKSNVSELLNKPVYRPEIDPGTTFYYKAPPHVAFRTEQLQDTLRMIESIPFVVATGGNVLMPPELKSAKIKIGSSVYSMGIGGLHSNEKCVTHYADDEHLLVDRDVASYYPAIILQSQLYPKHMGKAFLKVYGGIVERRLEAKRTGDKVVADSLKITINGSFGKFGSKWSALYSPDLLIQTTITGQLSLLMLIEWLELEGISIVSANTDGIVIKCPRDKVALMDGVVDAWELWTGFETEAAHYKALHSRDVNNYIAIKEGGAKMKGAYTPAGLQKNPTNEICSEAVVKLLTDGTPVEQTIRQCADIRKFVTIRQVKGGAVKGDEFLGKAVRWYYATGVEGAITYKINGYTVARSEGAKPLMDLPDEFPTDIDYSWYIAEAYSILSDIGAI